MDVKNAEKTNQLAWTSSEILLVQAASMERHGYSLNLGKRSAAAWGSLGDQLPAEIARGGAPRQD